MSNTETALPKFMAGQVVIHKTTINDVMVYVEAQARTVDYDAEYAGGTWLYDLGHAIALESDLYLPEDIKTEWLLNSVNGLQGVVFAEVDSPREGNALAGALDALHSRLKKLWTLDAESAAIARTNQTIALSVETVLEKYGLNSVAELDAYIERLLTRKNLPHPTAPADGNPTLIANSLKAAMQHMSRTDSHQAAKATLIAVQMLCLHLGIIDQNGNPL